MNVRLAAVRRLALTALVLVLAVAVVSSAGHVAQADEPPPTPPPSVAPTPAATPAGVNAEAKSGPERLGTDVGAGYTLLPYGPHYDAVSDASLIPATGPLYDATNEKSSVTYQPRYDTVSESSVIPLAGPRYEASQDSGPSVKAGAPPSSAGVAAIAPAGEVRRPVAQAQQDEWAEYRNPAGDLRVSYPKSHVPAQWQPTADILESVSFLKPSDSGGDGKAETLDLTRFRKDKGQSLDEWLRQFGSSQPFGVEPDPRKLLFEVRDIKPLNDERSMLSLWERAAGYPIHVVLIDDGSAVIALLGVVDGAGKTPASFGRFAQSLEVANTKPLEKAAGRWSPDASAPYTDGPARPTKGAESRLATAYFLPWRYDVQEIVTQGPNCTKCASHYRQPNLWAYDFGTREGTELWASAPGSVAFERSASQPNDCGGPGFAGKANYVVLNHDDGYATLYLHLLSTAVKVGSPRLTQGQPIGQSGKTGWTANPDTGICEPHLHFTRLEQGGVFSNTVQVRFVEYPDSDLQYNAEATSHNLAPARLSVAGPLSLSSTSPMAGQAITASFRVRNDGGQPMTLQRVLVGGRGPNCADWACGRNADFPVNEWVTVQPGQEYTYSQTRSFAAFGDGYFAEPVYQDASGGWGTIAGGNRVGFSVRSAVGALQVVGALTLSPSSPQLGQTVAASFRVRNVGGQAMTIRRLLAGGRGPGCPGWDCANNADFPADEWITLGPGQEWVYSRTRTFATTGGGYFAEPVYQDTDGGWHGIAGANRVTFQVQDSAGVLQVVGPLTLSTSRPQTGQTVTASFRVRNVGGRVMTLQRLVAGGRGPNCSDWACKDKSDDPLAGLASPSVASPLGGGGGSANADFPYAGPITLQPGQEYTYSQSRSFALAGAYFAEPVFQDSEGTWRGIAGANRVYYTVTGAAPGALRVVGPLTLSTSTPQVGQSVTASLRVRNVGGQAMTIQHLVAGGRGPNCTDWACGRNADFPYVGPITLQAGQEYTYSQTRSFSQSGAYFAEPVFQDSEGSWRGIASANRVYYTVIQTTDCVPGSDGVVLYEHPNYGGRCFTWTAANEEFPWAAFNDAFSSIRFVGTYASGWKAVLYEHTARNSYGGVGGREFIFRSDFPDFGLLNFDNVASDVYLVRAGSCLAESPHPYTNVFNSTSVLLNPDPNAAYSRVYFTRLEAENQFDHVSVMNVPSTRLQQITGYYSSGMWSSSMPGRWVQIHLLADYSNTAWGYCVDRIETTSGP